MFWSMLKKRTIDAETTAKKELSQSNPRKQEVIPATNFEYSKICVMLRKVADDLCNDHFIGGSKILETRGNSRNFDTIQ